MRLRNSVLIITLLLIAIATMMPRTSYARDEAVHQAQSNLTKLGYDPGPSDGLWGAKTHEAVIRFQNDKGLKPTGKLNAETRLKLGVTIESKPAPVAGGSLIGWRKLSDPHSVAKRSLQQKMTLRMTGNRYIVDRADSDEPLTRAPGTYGGKTIMGIRGKAPRVKPLIGYVNDGEPDPEFYSVLGVGASLMLPREWVKIFGLRVRNGQIAIRSDGLLLTNVETDN